MPQYAEITSIPPITILSDGSDAADWSISGAAGGVGVIGINHLRQREYTLQDGLSNNSADLSKRQNIEIIFYNNIVIPPGSASTKAYQQWMIAETSYIGNDRTDYTADDRPCDYQHCQFFGELKAGSYKLVCEYYHNTNFPWLLRNHDNENPYIALLTESNQVLVKKSMNQAYAPVVQDPLFDGYDSANRKDFYHEEYSFTISEDTSVGFISKIYPESNNNVFTRFQIVSSDTVAESFYIDEDINGVTCWAPFSIVLPLRISSPGGGVTDIEIPLDNYLEVGDTISLMSTGITIPTYYGRNIITCSSEVQPTIYLKYTELDPVPMWAEERPAQISIYDIHEPQQGFDHNGVAILLPSEITSEKEDKGRWDLTLIHPIDAYNKWTYLQIQNCIKVNGQIFRIDSTEINIDADSEYITAHANHITYDMRDYYIEEAVFEVVGGDNYLAQLNAHRVRDFPNQQHVVGEYTFDLTSDLPGTLSAQLEDQSIIEAIFGADNSLTSRFGGEVFRDNFHMSVNQKLEGAPEGNAFSIRYGTDMTKISFQIDMSSWVTNLIAVDNFGNMAGVWYDTSGDWIVHHHKTKRVHFTYSDHAENMAWMYDGEQWIGPGESMTDDLARLIKDMFSYWDTVNTPKVSIIVGTAYIKGDPKYKDFINLQNFDVGYKGTVYVEHLGIDVEMKINSIRRNELTGEALQITLGNTRQSLIRSTVMSGTIVSPNSPEGKNTLITESLSKELYDTQTALMSKNISGMETFSIADLERRTIAELEG